MLIELPHRSDLAPGFRRLLAFFRVVGLHGDALFGVTNINGERLMVNEISKGRSGPLQWLLAREFSTDNGN